VPARLFIGTSSWADRSLVASGRFYPPDLKDTPSRLGFFAERFNLAEIDSTYYAFPSRKNTERWADAVPDGFRFNAKAFALFSQHPTPVSSIPASFREALPEGVAAKRRLYYKDVPLEMTEELWRIFLRGLQPLRDAGKLGALLIDFPPWFVPSQANRDYLRQAREHAPDDRLIVEFRNPLWVAGEETADATFALLRELDYGFVCVDEPPGLKSAFPPVVAATAAAGAVRFRGRNAARWDDKSASTEEKLDWWYTDDELREWLPRIDRLVAETEELYVSFSTKADDQSVVNATRLKRLLGLA